MSAHLQWSRSQWSGATALLWWASLRRVSIGDEGFEAGGAVWIITHDDVVVGHHVNVGLHHATIVFQWNYIDVAVKRAHLLYIGKTLFYRD